MVLIVVHTDFKALILCVPQKCSHLLTSSTLFLVNLLKSKIIHLKLKLLRASNTVSPWECYPDAFGRMYILVK